MLSVHIQVVAGYAHAVVAIMYIIMWIFFFVLVKLNGGRVVSGVLRGFDPYMNIVMDDTVEERSSSDKHNIGMVVRLDNWIADVNSSFVESLLSYFIYSMAQSFKHSLLDQAFIK